MEGTVVFPDRSNDTKRRVLVIGAAGLDIVGRPIGMPEPGTSTPAKVRPSFGGVAHNIAVNLAHLGQPVSLMTLVGKDVFGQQLLAEITEAGVDVSACLETDEYNTASYLAVLTESGKLHFALDDMRILSRLESECLRQQFELFKQSSLVFVDANLSPASLRTVFHLARRARVPVCADATSKSLAKRLQPFISRLTLLTANMEEAAVLCEKPMAVEDRQEGISAARHLINQGAQIALVTMAEFGVCYATSETSGHIPAIHTSIQDPTGAGDAQTATLIFGLMNDIPLDDAIRLGVSAASLTLRNPGTVYPELSLERLYDELVI